MCPYRKTTLFRRLQHFTRIKTCIQHYASVLITDMHRKLLHSLLTAALTLTALCFLSHDETLDNGYFRPGPLPKEVESTLIKIEAEARRSGASQSPSPPLLNEIQKLTELLPRSQATRNAQEKGRLLAQEALESRSGEIAERVDKMLSLLQDEIDRDATYAAALRALDARLYPMQTKATRNRENANRTLISNPSGLPFDKMRPGDIMLWNDRSGRPLIRLAVSLFAKDYSHSAIYLGEVTDRKPDGRRYVYEAVNVIDGTNIDLMDRKWKRHGLGVALGHVKGLSPVQAKRLALGAIRTFGDRGSTPYHVFPPWDKTYFNEGVYCSQLTWEPFTRAGIDIDSNDWRYLVWFAVHNWFLPYAASTAFFSVFPDEIKTSPHIDWYYDRLNR